MHKKGDKQVVNNCRPVSLLPICSKILEKIVLDSMMRFLNENKFLSNAQSGFRPPDSCECQVLLIVHDIYKSFDCNPPWEVREIFLDISKAFDRVCHDRLLYKIKSFGVFHTPLKLIEHFLSSRYRNSSKRSVFILGRGFSLGSSRIYFRSLVFLDYINDFSCGLSSTTKLFADDTYLLSVVHDATQTINELNKDLEKISNWAYQWKMSFNLDQSKQAQEVLFYCKT